MSVITIDYRDRRPIYEQLTDNIRELVLKKMLAPGEFLPSVRSLAGELGINPNTIQKAYSELERQGVIIPVSGKGSMVATEVDALTDRAKDDVLEAIKSKVIRAHELGIPRSHVDGAVNSAWEGVSEHD